MLQPEEKSISVPVVLGYILGPAAGALFLFFCFALISVIVEDILLGVDFTLSYKWQGLLTAILMTGAGALAMLCSYGCASEIRVLQLAEARLTWFGAIFVAAITMACIVTRTIPAEAVIILPLVVTFLWAVYIGSHMLKSPIKEYPWGEA